MTTPHLVNGRYHVGGTSYPRVSDILATLAKPGLDAWKRRVGFTEADRVSREATALGTAVHALCEQLAAGKLWAQDLTGDLAPYGVKFAWWLHENVAAVISCERTVIHEAHGYAGTLDLYAEMADGRRLVCDLKTGKTVDPTYRLQLTAYAAALEAAGEQVDGRLVIHLPSSRPGELHAIEFDDDDRDRKAWLALVRLYRWQERHKDDWKASR